MKLKYTTMINKYITTMAALTLSFGANAQTNTPEQKLPSKGEETMRVKVWSV